jgi:EAL domain-containing protein (putative c-di-GMP-specific phosphodiesterase class I)
MRTRADAPRVETLGWPDAIDGVLAEPGLVRPVFQPIVDIQRGGACGFEALARFESPLDAPPPAWIEAAYRLGAGERLEALLLARGLDAASDLPPNCFLTVNVSPRALVSPSVAAVLAERRSLAKIVLEVTEQAEVEDYAELQRVIAAVRDAGGALAVDDAGAGYASLSHILALRPEFVKLDRGLVSGIDGDEAKRAVVESLGTFAGRLDAWLVAEGVERAEEAAALQRIGVPLAQGYGLGRPAPAMTPLDPSVAASLTESLPLHSEDATVEAIVEAVPGVPRAGGTVPPGPERHVAILDGRDRPLALHCRESSSERPAMRVEAREPIAAVARRALTRPPAQRFDPLVCCDGRGAYRGLVNVERLIERLAALVEDKEKAR